MIGALCTAGSALAQGVPAGCEVAGACRLVGEVSVPVRGAVKSIRIDRTMPWIAENNLVLYPGESVVVSLPNDAQGLLPLTLVATGEDAKTHALAPGEISFEFTVNKDGVTLKAQSAHGRWLHYMLVMVTPDGKPHKTSVCPIMAGKGAYEFWPHGIVQLALANFTPVAEGEMVCK